MNPHAIENFCDFCTAACTKLCTMHSMYSEDMLIHACKLQIHAAHGADCTGLSTAKKGC